MDLSDELLTDLRARLRRVEGQVRGLQTMITEGRDCADVVTQFAAARAALEHTAFKYFAATLAECARDPDAAGDAGYTPERLEKLFLQLA